MEGYPSWHRKQEATRSNDEAHKRFAAFLKDRESKKEAAKDQGDGELIEHKAGEPAASSQEPANSQSRQPDYRLGLAVPERARCEELGEASGR